MLCRRGHQHLQPSLPGMPIRETSNRGQPRLGDHDDDAVKALRRLEAGDQLIDAAAAYVAMPLLSAPTARQTSSTMRLPRRLGAVRDAVAA